MVLQVGAVLALVVLGAVTEVVIGQVEALGTVLARTGLTVVNVQLGEANKRTNKRTTIK